MAMETIEVQPRDIKAKSNYQLRQNKDLPAVIHRKQADSVSIQLPYARFIKLNLKELEFLNLKISGGESIVAFPKNIQKHPVSHKVLHAIFEEVQAGTKMTASVPVHLTYDEEKADWIKDGVLKQNFQKIKVEFLPKDLVSVIELDIQHLKVGDSIRISEMIEKYPQLEFDDEGDIEVLSIAEKREQQEDEPEEAEGTEGALHPETVPETETTSGTEKKTEKKEDKKED